MRRRRGLPGLLLAVLLTGCAAIAGTAYGKPAPGTLISATPMERPDPALRRIGAHEWRISYASRSGIDDHPVTVTGAVIVPAGDPPDGGWPVVSFAHGTTGVGDRCAPSRYPSLLGGVTVVLPLVARGYLVTSTDYEGLGSPGPHPYLLPGAAGRDVVDAVRAARALVPAASSRWVSVGVSQGGQAAWAAAELAGTWGAGLGFLGAVAFAPATDLVPLLGELSDHLNPVQKGAYLLLLATLKLLHPRLDYDDYLSGAALSAMSALDEACEPAGLGNAPDNDFVPRSRAALEQARQWLADLAVPTRRASGPLLVVQGLADPIIEPAWTTDSVRRACDLGDRVDYLTYPHTGHPAVAEGGDDAIGWVAARFAGKPAPSTC